MTACDDTTDTIGASLTDNMDNLKISTDSFRVSSRSVLADSVLSKNATGYLGRVKDPEKDEDGVYARDINNCRFTQYCTFNYMNYDLSYEDTVNYYCCLK